MSISLSSLDEDESDIKLLYPIEETRDIHFFYGIPEADLDEDPSLTNKIKKHVKSYKEEDVSTSFSVYSTNFENHMVLCTAYSSKIQPVLDTI